MIRIAPSYSDEQVLLCTVDAYVNSDLKKYLIGGYPTVRVFSKGKMGNQSFVGSKAESFVRQFIDSAIQNGISATEVDGRVMEARTSVEFYQFIANANVPVVAQFSSSSYPTCSVLNETMNHVSASYSDKQILFVNVDANVNTDLSQFALGAYPTVRVFSQGKVMSQAFAGSKSAAFVHQFVETAIQANVEVPNQLIELNDAQAFNQLIATAQVPVIVKFSAPG